MERAMKKPVFAGLFSFLFLLIIVGGSHSQEGQGHYIGRCPELKLWKNNALFLKAKDLYNRVSKPQLSPRVNDEWQMIVRKVDQLDAEMTEFVRTCSELKARADATNLKIDNLNRRGAEWNNRWAGKPMNSAAMAEKNQIMAEGNQIISEQRARNAEWRQMKAQREILNTKYEQLEQEIPRFISSVQTLATGGAPKSAGKPLQRAKSSGPSATTKTPTLQQLKEAHKLNEQGSRYYVNKQWKLAAEAFKAALERFPDNDEIRNNYELAAAHLEREEARQSKGSKKAGKQLKSVKYHSTTAKGLTDEAAKAEAMQGFDTGGKNVGSLEVDLSGVGKRPEWPGWVKTDKKMITMQKQQDAYKATYQQKDKELSQVRQEMQTADPVKKSELAVQAAKIKGDLAKAEYNIALKEKEIRKRAKRLIDTREEE
jgi:hypothetical protein